MPMSRSPIRTRSAAAPTGEAERDPLREDDRGRAARPADAVDTAEYLERRILESQETIAKSVAETVTETVMGTVIAMLKEMKIQAAAASNIEIARADEKQDDKLVEPRSNSPMPSEASTSTSSSLNPVAKELLRDVPKFSGKTSNAQHLAEFIAKMDDFLEVAYLSPLLEMKMAVSKLTSTAHIWWRTQEKQGTAPCMWPLLRAALRIRFTPPAHSSMIRDRLDELTQTSSVIAYNNAFNKLVMQLPEVNKGEIEHRYLKGLKRSVYSAIISNDIPNLDAMQEAATRQEQLTTERSTRTSRNTSPHVEAHAAYHNAPRKMWNHGKGGNKLPGSPCYLCDKTGHWMKDCPQMKTARELLKQQGAAAEANLVLATNHKSSHSIALNSCATHHVVKDAMLLTDLRPIQPVTLTVANGENLVARQVGTLVINNNDTNDLLICKDVLYVPKASRNLISTSPLNRDGYEIIFSSAGSVIKKDGHVVLPLRHNGNLPFINGYVETTAAAFALEAKTRTAMSINYGINALGTLDNERFKLRI